MSANEDVATGTVKSFGPRFSHQCSYKTETGKCDVAWSHRPTAVVATELPKELEFYSRVSRSC